MLSFSQGGLSTEPGQCYAAAASQYRVGPVLSEVKQQTQTQKAESGEKLSMSDTTGGHGSLRSWKHKAGHTLLCAKLVGAVQSNVKESPSLRHYNIEATSFHNPSVGIRGWLGLSKH